jgi:hypothetical protein
MLTAALLFPAAATAQWVPGIGEDASIPAPGTARAGVSFSFEDYDRRFSRTGDGTVEPLGADFNAVNVERLAGGQVTRDRVRSLAAIPNLTLTLGDLDVRLRGAVERYPMTLELGVLRRVALTLMVPIVRTRTTVIIGPDIGTGATAGLNPARTLSGALANNVALSGALANATQELRNLLAQCEGSSDPECQPVNDDRAAAEAFATGVEGFTQDLEAVYVNGIVVPVTASEADIAIAARLAAMRTQFQAYGVGALAGAPERPVGAAPIAHEELQALVTNPVFGISADPLFTVERTSIGDIETGAKVLLVDAIDPAGRRPFGFRLLAGGLVRLGTGSTNLPGNLIDIPTGDGQTDIEGMAVLDAVVGRRVALTARARYTRQLEDEFAVRVPELPGQPFVPAERLAVVTRDLGDIVSFEAVPRIAVHELMSVAGYYSIVRKGADSHRAIPVQLTDDDQAPPEPFDPGPLDVGTSYTAHRVGFGVGFSNLGAHRRGRARFPYEISYLHLRTTRSSGLLPRSTLDRIQLKVYVPIWGR